MQCPFLRETQTESCRHSLVRKLIVRNPENLSLERCSSQAYEHCPMYQSAPLAYTEARCPYLDESLAQYCGAAPVPKLIPFSEAVLSRCGSSAHRYCDLYITMAHPPTAEVPEVYGIPVPPWLHYAPNHMWLDRSEEGLCHIGVDALFAFALGKVDRITFLTSRGAHHPAVVLSAGDKDFHMVFPNKLYITGTNVYLRANPVRLTSDPYRSGWLFECRPAPEDVGVENPCAGLHAGGGGAVNWMRQEYGRIGSFVHSQAGIDAPGQGVLVADGGHATRGFVEHLDREQAARLHHGFFSPAWMR
jgi:glycine cleavage system H lipoate-binding protein